MTEPNEWHEPEYGAVVVNETDIPTQDVMREFRSQHPEYAALTRWTSSISSSETRRQGSLMDRDRYVTPGTLFDQFRMALDAAESDDVVSGVLESTEALAFDRVSISCADEQEEDIWNQVIEDIELDKLLREMWRETFVISQFYAGLVWGNKQYKVRGKTKNGNKSKKSFGSLRVPLGLTILDPLKVVPVGNSLFGQNRLAYIASKVEALGFDDVLAGKNTSDQVVDQLIDRKMNFMDNEKDRLQIERIEEFTGVRHPEDVLFLLNPKNVFRHTATKPDYQTFATVRMKSVFELLDIKHQLRQMDRVHLLASTNFIVLVKKGSDDKPATAKEIAATGMQMRASSRLPVIISDHRIEIEIITPKTDFTLKPERYNTIDARITARLYQMFMTGNYSAGAAGDDSLKLARVVARGMESRRYMIAKTIEKYVLKPIFNDNDQLTEEPSLELHPKRIALDFDNNIAAFMQDLRDRGDISRETLLSELNIDQSDEARKREREKENGMDKIFGPTNVPFSTPNPQNNTDSAPTNTSGNSRGAGRRGGGNSNGGGINRQSGVSQPGRGTLPEGKIKGK